MATVRRLGFVGPHFYVCTKFDEVILICGGDMPPKRNSKNAPWRLNFYFRSDAWESSGTFVCVAVHDFSQIVQLSAEL